MEITYGYSETCLDAVIPNDDMLETLQDENMCFFVLPQ